MNDIQLLKKYSAQRKKWKNWECFSKGTDLQRLSRLEGSSWSLLVLFAVSISRTIGHLNDHSLFSKLLPLFILCFMGYLSFEIHRAMKLRSIFERTAIQNYDELIAQLENSNTEQAVPGYPPQGVGSPEP